MLVVEVRPTSGQALGENCQPLHGSGRRCGFVASGVGAGALLRGLVVIATDHDQRGRVPLAQGTGHGTQVARMAGHGHGVASRLKQAGGCGVALRYQHNSRRVTIGGGCGTVQHMKQASDAAALEEQLVRAGLGWRGCDALQVPQLARRIAQRHQ